MEKTDIKELAKALHEENKKTNKELAKEVGEEVLAVIKAQVEELLEIDLSTQTGRVDCRETWKSAKDVKEMRQTARNRFGFIVYGALIMGIISIFFVGIKYKIEQIVTKGE